MYALVKEKGKDSWQYSYFKVVMEGLITTLIIFNPSRAYWAIDDSFWWVTSCSRAGRRSRGRGGE